MHRLGRSRRRTGAERWSLYQDAADPDHFVESWVVDSWEEHLRQQHERQTAQDQLIEEAALALTDDGGNTPPHVFIFAYDT